MIDSNSPTWRAITEYATQEIDRLRDRLEESGLGATEAENLRGQIVAWRAIAENRLIPKAPTVAKTDTYGL